MQNNKLFTHSLTAVLGFVLCLFLLEKCDSSPDQDPVKASRTETLDTTYIYKDTGSIKEIPVPVPYPVAGEKVRVPYELIDSSMCSYYNVYNDSIRNSEVTIFWNDTVQGVLRSRNISYRLKLPSQLQITHTIIDSVPYSVKTPSNGIYVSGGLGITPEGVNTVLVGADYISKKKWGVGYQYDIARSTHLASFKYLLK